MVDGGGVVGLTLDGAGAGVGAGHSGFEAHYAPYPDFCYLCRLPHVLQTNS